MPVAAAMGAFALLALAAALRSRGFFENDSATHYLFARHAFAQPCYWVDVWGRPFCTAILALPARLMGVPGARLVNIAVALGCGGVAYRLAAGQGYPRPILALIFTLGQPLLFLHAISTLTELPFALLLGCALLAFRARRWGVTAILLALLPLARPEGFVFLILGAIALAWKQQRRWLIVLPIGIIAWSVAGYLLARGPGDARWWTWLPHHWPYEASSEYPRRTIFQFIRVLPMLVGPLAFPAMWIGMALCLFSRRSNFMDLLIGGLPLALLLGHSLFSWLGIFSSNGELRYLLIVAPLWGTLSGRGWAWVFDRLRWRQPAAWAALAVIVPGLVNFFIRVLPLQPTPGWLQARLVADWYAHAPLRAQYPRVLANHPGIYFYLDISPADPRAAVPWTRDNVDHPAPGTLLIWDPEFSARNANPALVVPLRRVIDDGWIEDRRAELQSGVNATADAGHDWHIFLSPRSR